MSVPPYLGTTRSSVSLRLVEVKWDDCDPVEPQRADAPAGVGSISLTDPSVADATGLIRLVEKATGQPKLKRMYVHNQRFPRVG